MRQRRTPSNNRNYSNDRYDNGYPVARGYNNHNGQYYQKKRSPILTIIISLIGGAAVAVGGMLYYEKHTTNNTANEIVQPATVTQSTTQSVTPVTTTAKIIAVTPNYTMVDKPVKACKTVESQVLVANPNTSTTTGTAIGGATGAVAGGIIGNQIKQGGGGTIVGGVLGAAAGALVGHEVQKANQPQYITKTEPVKVCHTETKSVKEVSNYNIQYVYNGQTETAVSKKKYKVGSLVDYTKLQANFIR